MIFKFYHYCAERAATSLSPASLRLAPKTAYPGLAVTGALSTLSRPERSRGSDGRVAAVELW